MVYTASVSRRFASHCPIAFKYSYPRLPLGRYNTWHDFRVYISMINEGPHAVIADDLTGAIDTGVHFLTHQSRPLLKIANGSPLRITNSLNDEVLVLDTETRLLNPREAYNQVQSVSSELMDAGYQPIFKKIDSTFRGNVGTEIDAMLDLPGFTAAAVVSAVPRAGRKVRNGICLVRGIPLHESESGNDRLSPHKTSSIQEIIASQSRRKSVLIDHTRTSLQPQDLAMELERHLKQGVEILLFDAASDNDIRGIIKALQLLPQPLLLVGAAGLAEALSGTGTLQNTDSPALKGPGLFVSGSLMQTTAVQADQLAGHTDRVGSIVLRQDAMKNAPANEANRIVDKAATLAESGRHILFRTNSGISASNSPILKASANDIVRFIASCTRRILDTTPIGTLVLSGGSTAVAVMEALDIATLRVIGEVESGIPVCEAGLSRHGRHCRIVTKAGGFGEVASYVKIMEMMGTTMRRKII